MFDGVMMPSYVNGISSANPTVILIENLPFVHIQSGAWVGWTTRYLPATRFKIEGFDTYGNSNTWRVIADYSATDYDKAYTKLKFTFYKGISGYEGTFGLSELFFIHPEANFTLRGFIVFFCR